MLEGVVLGRIMDWRVYVQQPSSVRGSRQAERAAGALSQGSFINAECTTPCIRQQYLTVFWTDSASAILCNQID
jgi:hypothetical protein